MQARKEMLHDQNLLVNISYAILDIISAQFKIISVAYPESLIETQLQDRHSIYPRKPSRGRKPSKNSFV